MCLQDNLLARPARCHRLAAKSPEIPGGGSLWCRARPLVHMLCRGLSTGGDKTVRNYVRLARHRSDPPSPGDPNYMAVSY